MIAVGVVSLLPGRRSQGMTEAVTVPKASPSFCLYTKLRHPDGGRGFVAFQRSDRGELKRV
jgi:hypothetical protein